MPAFPVHTPYDGSRRPFAIGLAPLDLAGWIEVDDRLAGDLAEKDRLLATRRDAVFREEPETRAAQREVLDLVADHVIGRFPDRYVRRGDVIRIAAVDRAVDLAEEQPLVAAARLVQEDLVLMRRGPQGWRLAAAVLCFPSSWSLAEKFGGSLDAIHAPVPGYAETLSARVARIFDALRVETPLWRLNWSIYPDADLHHPEPKTLLPDVAGDIAAHAFVRVERQTLRRLPMTGDVLFTIRIHVDPVASLRAHPEGARLAAGLALQIRQLTERESAYKGLAVARERLLDALDLMAAT